MNIYKNIKTYIVKHTFFICVVAIIIVGGLVYWYIGHGTADTATETIVVARGDLSEEVSVTGKVKPAESVALAFEKGGRVARVYTKVGDIVASGQILVAIENADVYAGLLQAEANLQAENARLSELKKGARAEELAVEEAKVKSAENSLKSAEQNLVNVLDDAYTKADDAVRNKTDQLFSNPRTVNPSFNFIIDGQLRTRIETERVEVERTIVAWRALLGGRANSIQVKNNLSEIKKFIDDVALAVNSLSASSALSQTIIDWYRADILSARNNIYTAISGVTDAVQDVDTARLSFITAERQLDLLAAGSTVEKVATQEAAVRVAEANIANYHAQIGKTIIRAPIAGTVTKQEAHAGEIATAGLVIVALISEGRFEIESFVPEADIANVKKGDTAAFTLDAYGDEEIFTAEVYGVDPAETVIEGVPTYKVILQFTNNDGRVRSGMTANIDIITAKKENVFSVPSRAVHSREDGTKFVETILSDGVSEEKTVTTGIRGSDGRIEIVSGLDGGETVLVFKK